MLRDVGFGHVNDHVGDVTRLKVVERGSGGGEHWFSSRSPRQPPGSFACG